MSVSVRRAAIPPAGLLQLAGSVVMFGSAWPVTKLALQLGAGPLWFATGRAAFSGLAATVVLALAGRLRRPGRADLPALGVVGAFQLAAFFALAHAGAGFVPAGRTAVLANTTTIFVVPLSLLVLREPIPRARWWAAGVGVLGVVVLMNPWSIDWSSPAVLIGHGLLLAAALSWSVAIIFVRRYPPALSMLELLPWCFALASLLLAPLLLIEPPGLWPPRALLALGLVGAVAGPVGTWCVLQAAATLPVVVASIGFLITPAAGLALSLLWLHEAPDAGLLAGAALILGGVGLAAWPR